MILINFIILIQHIAIDLGSQYIKTAESTFSGIPQIKLDHTNNVFIPSAATLKTEESLTKGNYSEFSGRFGQQALSILKRRPYLGIEFLPRTIGRSKTNFHSSRFFSPSELMTLYLNDFVTKFKGSPEFTFIVPFYWVKSQRKALTDICHKASISISNIIDDIVAVAAHYSSILYHRFDKKSRNVLFIDIGSTSIKTYGFTFYTDNGFSFANETSNLWSEKTGGYFFAKEISKIKKISIKKSIKILTNNPSNTFINLLNESLIELKNIIKESKENMETILLNSEILGNSKKIDEVQIIGGASKYKFIYDLIKEILGIEKINRDMNPIEAIAIGGVYSGLMVEGLSIAPPCQINRKPHSSITITCSTTQKYCQKGSICRDVLTESGLGCEIVSLNADNRHIPEGTDTLLAQYKLNNISNIKIDNDSLYQGYFHMSTPASIIQYVQWCRNSTCLPIIHQPIDYDGYGEKPNDEFINNYLNLIKENRKQKIQFEKVIGLLKSISDAIQNAEKDHPGISDTLPFNERNEFLDYLKLFEEGILDKKNSEELRNIYDDLTRIARDMFSSKKSNTENLDMEL